MRNYCELYLLLLLLSLLLVSPLLLLLMALIILAPAVFLREPWQRATGLPSLFAPWGA